MRSEKKVKVILIMLLVIDILLLILISSPTGQMEILQGTVNTQ